MAGCEAFHTIDGIAGWRSSSDGTNAFHLLRQSVHHLICSNSWSVKISSSTLATSAKRPQAYRHRQSLHPVVLVRSWETNSLDPQPGPLHDLRSSASLVRRAGSWVSRWPSATMIRISNKNSPQEVTRFVNFLYFGICKGGGNGCTLPNFYICSQYGRRWRATRVHGPADEAYTG